MFAQINLTHLALMEKNQSNSTTNGAFNFQNFGNLSMSNLDGLISPGGFLHSPVDQQTPICEDRLASLISGELNNNNPLAINNNLITNASSLQFGDSGLLSNQSLHSPSYANVIGHNLPSPGGLFTSNSTQSTPSTFTSVLNQPSLHMQQQQPNLPNLPNASSRMLNCSSAIATSTGPGSIHHQTGSQQSSRDRLKPRSIQIKHKFGRLGQGNGQLSSPHGFCLGADEEIIIADTFNHRICIFDKNGQYKDQFGKQGKEDGHLWYPRKVSI